MDVTANDTDSEVGIPGGVVIIAAAPTNGPVTVNSNRIISCLHDGSETKSGSTSYMVEDPSGAKSNIAIAAVVIDPVNDLPIGELNGAYNGTAVEALSERGAHRGIRSVLKQIRERGIVPCRYYRCVD